MVIGDIPSRLLQPLPRRQCVCGVWGLWETASERSAPAFAFRVRKRGCQHFASGAIAPPLLPLVVQRAGLVCSPHSQIHARVCVCSIHSAVAPLLLYVCCATDTVRKLSSVYIRRIQSIVPSWSKTNVRPFPTSDCLRRIINVCLARSTGRYTTAISKIQMQLVQFSARFPFSTFRLKKASP